MTWKKYTNKTTDRFGKVMGNVRIIVDYHEDEGSDPRSAGLLEVKDYTLGTDDSITLNPSDQNSITLTEGSDFTAETSDEVTAQNIASAINSLSNFNSSADGIWVSLVYSSDNLTNLSSDDTDAWAFYTINATNGTIMQVASDDSGSVKHQPLWTDSDGFVWAYIDRPAYVDFRLHKSGKPTDDTRTEDIYLP